MNKKVVRDGVAPSPKVTKDSLLKENAVLMNTIERERHADLETRKVFSELLDSFEIYRERYGNNREEKRIVVLSWQAIAFKMGELKSDADYSLILDANKRMEQELHTNQYKIAGLQQLLKKYEKKKDVSEGDDML